MVSCRRNVHFCKNHVFYLGATPILQTLVILANLGFLSPGIKFACAGADKSRFTVLFPRRHARPKRFCCYLQYILAFRAPTATTPTTTTQQLQQQHPNNNNNNNNFNPRDAANIHLRGDTLQIVILLPLRGRNQGLANTCLTFP